MKVAVVGSGGREHALAACLARTADVVVTPGNPGIPWSTSRPVEELDVDLVVVGPETPLVDGLADRLRAQGRSVFGPGADGAQLEGSKAWMKDVLVAAGVPTAGHGTFDDVAAAEAFLDTMGDLFVIKTDGLAAGKGVLVTSSRAEASAAVREYLSGERFGDAGRRLVIEEGLTGPEVSLLVICDGHRLIPLAPAQDYKRVGTGDTGPNTGGMGAYSPVPGVTSAMVEQILDTAVGPTLRELQRRGIDYRGVLYTGIMLTPAGPKVIEYNVRFGDPETQVLLPRFAGDLAALLQQAANGAMVDDATFNDDAAVTVVCATEGYPGALRTGDPILGLDAARAVPGVQVFAAGVGAGPDGRLVTAGGRVLNVTAVAPTIAQASAAAYTAVGMITWPGMHARADIARFGASNTEETR